MSEQVSAFPLAWPAGWPRSKTQDRARFSQKSARGWSEQATVATARERLQRELDLLRAGYITLSTNLETRLDGMPRSGQAEPRDAGVALYFRMDGRPMALACDKWDRVVDNIIAISKHIEALRGMDRWGVGTARQAFAGYEALPAPKPWWEILGLNGPNQTHSAIIIAYRQASQAAHPDKPGGSHDRMAAVNAARDEGLARFEGQAA